MLKNKPVRTVGCAGNVQIPEDLLKFCEIAPGDKVCFRLEFNKWAWDYSIVMQKVEDESDGK